MKVNGIYHGDCQDLMHKMFIDKTFVNLIITSPPYNTERQYENPNGGDIEYRKRKHIKLYDEYKSQTDEEYVNWTKRKFKAFNKILKPNGVVLYNLSYGNSCTQKNDTSATQLFNLIHEIIQNTPFMVADVIIWKKKSALPNNTSRNKLTRICEFVFVFCRKSEYSTFTCNKKIVSRSSKNHNYYSNLFNFVEAKNNDGRNELNQATYSVELVEKLLSMYGIQEDDNFLVFDPFSGTGTTAVACKKNGFDFIGCELSNEQCIYARKRLKGEQNGNNRQY